MNSSSGRSAAAWQLALGGALLSIAYILIPLVFGQRIEVSPFLLFAIVFVCNIAQVLVPEPKLRTSQTAFRLFCARLAVSALLSVLLIAIYRIARALG
jgi:hypothetical protein